MNTHLICATEPECLCTGDNSCYCQPDEVGARCAGCGAVLELVDVSDGSVIPPHRFEEAHDDPAPATDCWDCGQPRGYAVHVATAPLLAVALGRLAALGTEE